MSVITIWHAFICFIVSFPKLYVPYNSNSINIMVIIEPISATCFVILARLITLTTNIDRLISGKAPF